MPLFHDSFRLSQFYEPFYPQSQRDSCFETRTRKKDILDLERDLQKATTTPWKLAVGFTRTRLVTRCNEKVCFSSCNNGHPTCLGLIRLMGRSWFKLMFGWITFGPDIESVENVLQALLAHMSHLWPQSYIHKVERPWSILWWKTLVICLLRNIFGSDSLPSFVPFVFFMHIDCKYRYI